MIWIIFALGAVLAWGVYGVALHRGQMQLGNPYRALLCVGVAYFLIGVLVPLTNLSMSQGGVAAGVFGGAPLVNVLVSMAAHPPKNAAHPLLYVGFLMTALGAGLVLYYKPS